MKKFILVLQIVTVLFIMMCTRLSGQIINTYAGSGTPPNNYGFTGDGGQATNATLYYPVGVITDDTGNVYIADSHNGAIRKVEAATGIITTIAGNGTSNSFYGDGIAATAARLNDPQQIIVDDSGNLFFADYGNMVIRKITMSTGIITTIAGTPTVWNFSGDGGQATAATLSVVTGVNVDDSGNIYIADQWNHRIREVTKATGIINTIAGTGTAGFNGNGIAATSAELAYPTGIVLDDSANIYFTDAFNNQVRKITKATGIITDFAGNPTVTTGLGTGGFSGDGGQASVAQLNYPNGIFRDNMGNIYIGDWNNQVIRKVSPTGIITTVAGDGFGRPSSNGGYSGDGGPATDAELNGAEYPALDKCGNMYIGDMFNHRVRVVTPYPDTITVTPAAPSLCAGSSDTLKASGAGTYSWSPATGLSATTGSIVVASPAITTTYTISGTNGCNVAAVADTIVVTVTPFQGAISVTPDTASVCNGQTITLVAYGGVGATYVWIGTSDVTDSIAVNPKQDTTYELMVTSGTCSKDTLISVTVNNAPPLAINPPSPAIECNGEGIVLTVPASGSDYVWRPATGLSATTGSMVIANPTTDITYTVTGLDSLGCAVTDSEVINIQLGPSKPIITVSTTGDTLFSSAANGNQWFLNGTAVHGAIDSIFVVKGLPNNDSITVSVTNVANGCSTTSDLFITGVNPLAINSSQLSIYPNPTNGTINVNISSSVAVIKNWTLQLTDVLGRTIYTKSSLNYNNEINLSGLPGGVYFITIVNKTGRAVFAVVKQN